jgi:hypothetical protein
MSKSVVENNVMEVFKPKTVTIKQFKRNGWLPPGHDGEYRYTNTFVQETVQVNSMGQYITGLTPADEERLENAMKLPKNTLSRYNKDFWGSFKIRIPKTGLQLNLEDPEHELIYLVCRAHQKFAKSEAEIPYSPFAEYVIIDKEESIKAEANKFKIKREAYKKFGQLKGIEEMRNVLKVYGTKPSKDSSLDFIEAQLCKLIEEKPEKFLEIVEDPYFKMKVFIEDCIEHRHLIKNNNKYILPGGDVIGLSLEETIQYLSNPKNQDVYLSLKGKLQNSK